MALPEDDQAQIEEDVLENLRQEIEDELDQSQRELKEIALMLEQSEVEVDKLAQRNATITPHFHHRKPVWLCEALQHSAPNVVYHPEVFLPGRA